MNLQKLLSGSEYNKVSTENRKVLNISKRGVNGVGNYYVKQIVASTGLSRRITPRKLNNILLKDHSLNVELIYLFLKQAKLLQNVKDEKEVKTNNALALNMRKALRKAKSLPIRGQRTHTNAQTARKLN